MVSSIATYAQLLSCNLDDQELVMSDKSEVKCLWAGLFSILNSRHSHAHAAPFKLISTRRHPKSSTKLDAFDQVCRKIQMNEETNLANIRINATEKSVRNLILDDMNIDTTKTDPELVDRPAKASKAARKKENSQRAYQSLSKPPSLFHTTPSEVDEKIMQQARTSLETFIDQMFVDGKLVRKDGTGKMPMLPFSRALEVLSKNKKDLLKEEPTRKSTLSVGEIKQKLKHKLSRNDVGVSPSHTLPQRRSKAGDDCKFCAVGKTGAKLEPESDIACSTETVRKKIDLSSSRFLKKQDFVRLKNLNAMNKTSVKAPRKNPSSTEQEFELLSPRKVSQRCSCSARARLRPHNNLSSPRTCLSPLRTNTEATSCDDEPMGLETEIIFDLKVTSDINRTDTVLRPGEDDMMLHYTSDSISENETITSTVEDVPSTPTSILGLNMSESIKSQEELHSPVSVLENFFTGDANNPSNFIMIQTDRKRLQPTRLYFEECSVESSPQDYISRYVRLVLRASFLNWDRLLKTGPRPQKLLRESLFDEVEFSMPCDYCYFDPMLLFDHVNEVLLRIQRSRFSFLPRPVLVEPKNSSVPLEELVLDEIKSEEFYLLPATEERTVDQLVANDMSGSRPWIDVRTEAEYIMIQISEHILQESVVDVLLGFKTNTSDDPNIVSFEELF